MRRDVVGLAVAGTVVLAAGNATVAGLDWAALGRWLAQHAGLIAVFCSGALLLGLAIWRAGAPRRRVSPALSWWVVAGAGALVVAAAWGATAWLLHEANQAKDPPAARVEAIKTGLGVAAGTAGVFALLLAVRRQWHQELSAADTTHDATERRVTELYTKAVEQLGSPQAPVRLGGLYALERVAQNNIDQRQTVVNVLCAYLRMPYVPPGTSESGAPREELEVRLAAQSILTKHLRPGDTLWQEIDLDLTDAALVNWRMSECRVHNATFDRARFTGDADFDEVHFTGDAEFNGAEFGGNAEFNATQFYDHAEFDGARFTGNAKFIAARFTTTFANFRKAQFTGEASFSWVYFARHVVFSEAHFDGEAAFRETHFGRDAGFRKAHFTSPVVFSEAHFGGIAGFNEARFGDDVWFIGAQFTDEMNVEGATFERGAPNEIAVFVNPTEPDDASG